MQEADSFAAAARAAVRLGHPVGVSSETSATNLTLVNPDGSFSQRLSAVPVRWRDDGQVWRDIDLSLVAGAGGWQARSARSSVVVPADASGAVLLPSPAGPIVLSHPGARGAAVVSGSSVVYPKAVGGRDLTLQLLVHGVEETVSLASAAAASSYDSVFTLPVGLSAGSVPHGVGFTDAKGMQVAQFGAGLAFDAAGREAPVTSALVALTGRVVTVRSSVPAAWLADPARVFPVQADPTYYVNDSSGTGGNADSYVSSGSGQNASLWGASELRIGYGFGSTGTDVARALLRFNLGSVPAVNVKVTEAHVRINNFQASSCTATAVTVKGLAGAFGSATTWNTQPGPDSNGAISVQSFAHGFNSSCLGGWDNLDVSTLAQKWMDTSAPNFGVRLQATELSSGGWKKFYSGETGGNSAPALYVTYTHRPQAPTSQSSTPTVPCVTGTGRPFLASRTPVLTVTTADVDGDWTRALINMVATGTTTPVLRAGYTTPSGTQGIARSWPVSPALNEGGTYSWQAQGDDGITVSRTWSTWCEFTVDTVAPTVPDVTSGGFAENAWSPAVAGSFALSATDPHMDHFVYGIDQGAPDTVLAGSVVGSTGTATLSLPQAPTAGRHLLLVSAVDRAGNTSAVRSYSFSIKDGALSLPAEGAQVGPNTRVQVTADPTFSAATLQWRRGDTDSFTTIADGRLATLSNTAVSQPLALTGGVSPTLVWDAAGTPPDGLDGPLQIQAVLTGGAGGVTAVRKIILDVNHAGAASSTVGPASVNLLTGNATFSDSDVSIAGYGSDLSVSRTLTSRLPDAGAGGIFGPGWVPSVMVEAANSDFTGLTVSGTLVSVTQADGSSIGFTRNSAAGFTSEIGSEQLTLSDDPAASPARFTLSDTAGNATVFTQPGGIATAWLPTAASTPGAAQTTSMSWENVAGINRPTRMLAPVPAGVSCPAYPAALVRGCRALSFGYASSTTAGLSDTVHGAYTGRLVAVSFIAWDPASSAVSTTEVVRYGYDNTGRLREVWDPRVSPNLMTAYSYDPAGHLASLTPPGLAPWTFAYTTGGGTHTSGRHPINHRTGRSGT